MNPSRNAGQTCAATPKSAAPYAEVTSFEVVTSAGAVVHAFDDPKAAKAWVAARMLKVRGLRLHVEEVTRTVRRRRITWLRSVA